MRSISDAAKQGLPGGIALVVSANGLLEGVVTDGDLRRGLLDGVALDDSIGCVMTRDPIVFPSTMTYREILDEIPRRLTEKKRYRSGIMEKVIIADSEGRVERVLDFLDLWRNQTALHRHVAIVGLGYVGLTLAVTLAEAGFRISGIEASDRTRDSLLSGTPHFHEVGLEPLLKHHLGRNLIVGDKPPIAAEIYVLSVATPVRDQRPDLTELLAAARQVAEVLSYGDLVVLRSTCPVGVTRNEVLPVLESISGMRCGRDFFLAFAPERTVEGMALSELRALPQVIGGYDQNSVDMAASLFREITPLIITVSSLEAAEMIKLANNSFRDLNFAFANQLAMICEHYNLDTTEIVRAANREYPRDRIPVPSPGVGGPCLKKDPYIFAEAARAGNVNDSLSLAGRAINEAMPALVVNKLIRALDRNGKRPADCVFFLIGFAFKGEPETSDVRDSTTLDVLNLLKPLAREIRGYDPVVPADELAKLGVIPCGLEAGFEGADCAVVLNNHRSYAQMDIYSSLAKMNSPAVYADCWHIFSPEDVKQIEGITCVGLGFTV
jgi:nucleotide sugar dehydrogenase